jgi:hypothetical protein
VTAVPHPYYFDSFDSYGQWDLTLVEAVEIKTITIPPAARETGFQTGSHLPRTKRKSSPSKVRTALLNNTEQKVVMIDPMAMAV